MSLCGPLHVFKWFARSTGSRRRSPGARRGERIYVIGSSAASVKRASGFICYGARTSWRDPWCVADSSMAGAGRVSHNSVLSSKQIRLGNPGNLNRAGFVAATRAKHIYLLAAVDTSLPAV